MDIVIDQAALSAELDQLAAFSSSEPPGVTRVLWSAVDLRARAFVRELCAQAGLSVREDGLGNLFARWEGREPTLPAVATGSHIDAIPNAGRYDGTVGVLGGLEALRSLRRARFKPRRSLEVVVFTAEEPTRFGIGCLGSRALVGSLSAEDLASLRDAEGRSLGELRDAAGYNDDLAAVRLDTNHYAAFVELHIEQGPLLEAAGLPIGAVTAIAAPASVRLHLRGASGHAGAVLMPDRRDALLAAAEIALAVERAALESASPDTVATTGVFRVDPGAINAIPGAALLEIDLRDVASEPRDRALHTIQAAVEEICTRRKINWQLDILNADPPATCDPQIIAAIEAASTKLGAPSHRMISRAYHDSLFMARICPVGMIFIPCRGGISHRPDEYAAPADIERGVAVLAHTLVELAA
jgi:N-carbamoyl-L-amino-acid hydrolase